MLSSIPEAFNSSDPSITYIKYAILAALAIFTASIPFFRLQGSFLGVKAAQRLIFIIRILTFIEMFVLLPLLYCQLTLGPPLTTHAITAYPNSKDG